MNNEMAEARCLCGGVRFAARLPAKRSGHCHCDNCRVSHSSGFWSWCAFDADAVETISGADLLTRFTCDVGSTRSFCSRCGTTMSYESPLWPDTIDLSRACLPDHVQPMPQKHVYADRAIDWAPILDDLPRFGGPSGFEPLGPS